MACKSTAPTTYIDESTGQTADSVYVTTLEGEEIGCFQGSAWCDTFIDDLMTKHGSIAAVFQGGSLDGFEAL